jgi:hypothetical protein
LNDAAAAFTALRPSTALSLKWQLFLTPKPSFNKQLKFLLYISVLILKQKETVASV